MTEQSKQLLLKDLCARLPYGVICTDLRHGDSKITEVNTEDGLVYYSDFDEYVKVENCRLYLRSMSSMTKEEKEEYDKTFDWDYSIQGTPFDWLNAHHFDYHGLIERGLAIDCTDLNIY